MLLYFRIKPTSTLRIQSLFFWQKQWTNEQTNEWASERVKFAKYVQDFFLFYLHWNKLARLINYIDYSEWTWGALARSLIQNCSIGAMLIVIWQQLVFSPRINKGYNQNIFIDAESWRPRIDLCLPNGRERRWVLGNACHKCCDIIIELNRKETRSWTWSRVTRLAYQVEEERKEMNGVWAELPSSDQSWREFLPKLVTWLVTFFSI